jgi:hypothetical protein
VGKNDSTSERNENDEEQVEPIKDNESPPALAGHSQRKLVSTKEKSVDLANEGDDNHSSDTVRVEHEENQTNKVVIDGCATSKIAARSNGGVATQEKKSNSIRLRTKGLNCTIRV